MYRLFALVFVLVAAACGGGDASPNAPFGGRPTNTATPSQQVAGVQNEPTATPTAKPTPPPSEYMVVDGDTLSEIATKFGTTVEALVLANGLADADSLVIGQLVKVTGATPLMPTPTGTATAAVTPSATPAQ